jgi:peptidoglycan/xylan/chitin deacetylase (PgdA/CDA1 family)
MIAGASWLATGASCVALIATAALAEVGSKPIFDDARPGDTRQDGGRLQPYVIEAPARRANSGAEAVPSPVPVTQFPVTQAPAAAPSRANGPRLAGGCANPNALGVAREVEIDATGGPRYGFQQYKTHDFLREGEIVLTFDDGPAPAYTNPILKALEHHCTKATFFIVGRNALAYPEVVRDEYARGHTIANHTWSHANLGPRRIVPKRTPQAQAGDAGHGGAQGMSLSGPSLTTSSVGGRGGDPFAPQGGGPQGGAPQGSAGQPQSKQPVFGPSMSLEKAKAEIELGFSATSRSLGVPMAPFFRFPYLGNSTAMQNYMSERNVAIFSIDVDSVDYRAKKADDVIHRVMTDLKDQKKGILLFHDIQPATAQALPTLLDMLHAKGYRVVHIKPKVGLQTIASYDARVGKDGVKQDAIAEKKPLVKRTVTWGMAPSGPAAASSPARETGTAVAARRPVPRGDVPGYFPPSASQPEILPWLTNQRRPNNGW